jgi:serine/threonine-protein kinase
MRSKGRSSPVRRRVWNVGRFLVLFLALIATYAVFFLAGLRVTNRAREVQTPDLRGKSVAEAKTLLGRMGLELRVDQPRRPDRSVPPDHVLSQDPEAGSVVRRQRPIRVRVSDGQREPVLPVVANLPERTAEVALSSEQVLIGYRAEVRSAAYGSGVVIAQDPAPGLRAAKVNLLVNRAESTASFVVPDLIGCLASRVVEVLRGQNFRVAVTSEVSYPGLPAGIVVRQIPQAGFRIQSTDTITLEVSR